MIVTRIKGVPTAVKKHLKPGTEIHWCWIAWHADITEIPGAVSRRNVHAAAKRHREMGKVSANAYPFLMAFGSRSIAACVVISKFDLIVNVVADGLHTLPAPAKPAELGPR